MLTSFAVSILINLAKVLGLSFVITRFAPLQILLELLQEKYPNIFVYGISFLFVCYSCCAFWIALVWFGLWYACAVYFIASVFDKSIGTWLNKVKF